MFKFIHAADVHLDSPLRGLDRYEGAPADEIRQATRRAFHRLVDLALEERVSFVILAGDIYDGEARDFQTALFFNKEMLRLREQRVQVYVVAGNHDADTRMRKKLARPDNVHVLSTSKPETRDLEEFGVAIHGQGFARQVVTEDLAVGYPPAIASRFNIGVLHTSLDGREGEPLPDRLVRGELAHADADYSRHQDQQDSILPESCILAADGDDRRDHGRWRSHPLLPARAVRRVHDAATAVLAPARADAAVLRGAHASRQGVVDPAAVGLAHGY
jgi:DNA repair exonuclease SbcCD nuclease subunit